MRNDQSTNFAEAAASKTNLFSTIKTIAMATSTAVNTMAMALGRAFDYS